MIWGGELMTELKKKEWKKVERRKRNGCVLFTRWPRGDPGTPALYLLWHRPPNIMSLMNIYLYIFLDLLCAERSCLAWPACHWTIWFSPGRFWRTRTESRSPARSEKTGLFSLICDSSAAKLCWDQPHGWRQRRQKPFCFSETFLRTAE